MRVLEAAGRRKFIAFKWDESPGPARLLRETRPHDAEEGLAEIRHHDAIYLGAVGFPTVARSCLALGFAHFQSAANFGSTPTCAPYV